MRREVKIAELSRRASWRSFSRAKHGVGARSLDYANDETPTAAASRLLLHFSKRPNKRNSEPAGPVVAFAALLDAMDAPVDHWL